MEKLMHGAKYTNKSIVKYFGKQPEKFRKEQGYNREIVLSDILRNSEQMGKQFEFSMASKNSNKI